LYNIGIDQRSFMMHDRTRHDTIENIPLALQRWLMAGIIYPTETIVKHPGGGTVERKSRKGTVAVEKSKVMLNCLA